MKQEINLEEIWQSVLHSYDMYIDYDLRGHSAIITAMKMIADKVLDLAAENANLIEVYNAKDNGFNGAWDIVLNKDSILQIKDWIK